MNRRIINQYEFYRLKKRKGLREKIKKIKKKLIVILFGLINYKKNIKKFNAITSFCLFVGSNKSGTTFISSLLNKHPNIAISKEINVINLIKVNIPRNIIFSFIIEKAGGKFKTIKVIGDKKAAKSSELLGENPKLLKKLEEIIKLPIKFIYVLRNPYDTISTISIRKKISVKKGINLYVSGIDWLTKLREQIPKKDLIKIKNEDFIKNPKKELKKLCKFLGVNVTKDYLDACDSIIYQPSHKSRYDINWTPKLIALVKKEINKYSFLREYSYEK